MQRTSTQQLIPFGLWELEANGTVRHYEAEVGEHALQSSEVNGPNFFEIVPSSQVQEFREEVQRFILGSAPAHSFDLTLHVDEESIRTRVLLASTHVSKSGGVRVILLHIRRAEALSGEAGVGRKML